LDNARNDFKVEDMVQFTPNIYPGSAGISPASIEAPETELAAGTAALPGAKGMFFPKNSFDAVSIRYIILS